MLKNCTRLLRKKLAYLYSKVDKCFQENVGFALADISYSKTVDYLHRDQDPSSLGVIRMLFGCEKYNPAGLTMLLDIPDERGGSSMDMRWGHPRDCHFPLFSWIQPLLMPHMAIVYAVLWLGALGVFLGYRFQVSSVMFAAAYWYLFLVEKSFWNNHSYLFGLVALLLATTHSNRYLSLDAYMDPSTHNKPVPQWNYTILKFQFFILYFIAGVKKGSAEWLSGYAMANLSNHWVFTPFRMFLTKEQTDFLVVHWFIFFFDLTVVFWMSWRRTRNVAVTFCIAFHLMNSRLFTIGMFPWVCLATLPLFYPVAWPKRLVAAVHKKSQIIMRALTFSNWKKTCENASAQVKGIPRNNDIHEAASNHDDDQNTTEGKREYGNSSKDNEELADVRITTTKDTCKKNFVACTIFTYMLIQAFLPFSHFITKGYNNWTNGLYGYSWDMMVNSFDTVLVVVKVVDNVNQRELYLQPGAWTPNDRWTRHGDMVHQYAHCIKRNFLAEIENTGTCKRTGCGDEAVHQWNNWKSERVPENISVYIDVWCSMNGRLQQRMFNPKIDLLQAEWTPFKQAEWLMPLLTDHTQWRELLAEIRNEVHSWKNSTGVLFVADFPEHHLENFIDENLTNVSLMVLDGQVAYEPAVNDLSKRLQEGWSVLLDAGSSVPVLSGQFHKVHVVGSHPACYMYTFTNTTEQLVPLKVKDRLPLWKEFSARIKKTVTFFNLICESFMELFFGIPMTIRIKRT